MSIDKSNPKDLLGVKKVPLGEVPPVAIAHESCAMLDGDLKYGYRNWRENDVQARIYIDACMRHLSAWLEGQDYAEDSGVHHLAHARACLGILLDAQENGNLIDNRGPKGPFPKVAERLSNWVKERVERHNKSKKLLNDSKDMLNQLAANQKVVNELSSRGLEFKNAEQVVLEGAYAIGKE